MRPLILFALLVGTLAAQMLINPSCEPYSILTEATVNGQDYQFRFFLTNPCMASVPAIMGASPHWEARITVTRIVKGKDGTRIMTQIGKPFYGVYTAGKCYEDKPEDLVRKAEAPVKEEQ